uniref:60S ribosomal protein L13a n=1 Tax=Rhizochromulina marina TaxID=1034831 RepID=A0A7S2RKC9_9STRA|eukprot:CAMPEP_0118962186 /NCGR_PEP_ID=MMETSP1173-20130426/612_1 /TAXON_ID=1034831 /ORGANISM="Rhizochromulina marina cf, Strain CCMP1243" /LENGTH=230 /DNA_ID=CAMNT_0006910417 /DNA_START=41 /DNA_END=733 /DNA_ORIENTATION=+
MFEKQIVVDGRGHMLGRLASVVAKELLSGQCVVVVRCEQLVVSGSLIRNKMKWARFLSKKTLTNPKRGPFHFRAPSRMFWRVVRGMIPHKTYRGQQAMARLQTFEGVPETFEKVKRMVVPDALKVLHSKVYRKTTVLGALASESGWKHGELIEKLEAQRTEKSKAFYTQKKEEAKLKARAEAEADLSAVTDILVATGYYIEPTPVGAMKALKAEFASSQEEAPAAVDEEE